MFEDIKNRKFLATLAGAIITAILQSFGVQGDGVKMAVDLVTFYVGVQGAVDLAKVAREKKP